MNIPVADPTRSARAAIGARVEDLIVERDLNPAELARKVGMNQSTLWQWRSGNYPAPRVLGFACRLADELGVSVDWLLGRTDVRETSR